MSLKERLNHFHQYVVANNLPAAKQPSFAWAYIKLLLVRRSIETFFSALLVFGGNEFLIQNHFFLPWWPSIGVAVAGLFLRGNSLLAGIFLGSLASFTTHAYAFLPALLLSTLSCAQAFLIRQLLLILFGAIAPLNRRRDYVGLVFICSIICALYTYALYTLTPFTHLSLDLSMLGLAFIGQLNGILCLVPLCLAFDPFVPKRYFYTDQHAWLWGGLLILIAHGLFFFLPFMPCVILSMVLIIMMGTYAYRFGLIPTTILWLAIAVLYLSAVIDQQHLFQQRFSLHDAVWFISLFCINLIVSLWIAIQHSPRHL